MTKPTSRSASEIPKAFSPSGTSARTAATGNNRRRKNSTVETKPDPRGMFAAALALAKKPKSKAEARRSLQEIGIITAAGDLSEHYKSKARKRKAVARKVVELRSKDRTTKAKSKNGD